MRRQKNAFAAAALSLGMRHESDGPTEIDPATGQPLASSRYRITPVAPYSAFRFCEPVATVVAMSQLNNRLFRNEVFTSASPEKQLTALNHANSLLHTIMTNWDVYQFDNNLGELLHMNAAVRSDPTIWDVVRVSMALIRGNNDPTIQTEASALLDTPLDGNGTTLRELLSEPNYDLRGDFANDTNDRSRQRKALILRRSMLQVQRLLLRCIATTQASQQAAQTSTSSSAGSSGQPPQPPASGSAPARTPPPATTGTTPPTASGHAPTSSSPTTPSGTAPSAPSSSAQASGGTEPESSTAAKRRGREEKRQEREGKAAQRRAEAKAEAAARAKA
ncbi:MAG: hypothetical protein ACRC9R_01850, partial [Enterovibrio sp.]